MNAVVQGALRGAIGSMAMTGMRQFTVGAGWVEQPPPQQMMRERVPKEQSRAFEEVMHWVYGAGGGVMFGLLPEPVRKLPGAGPAYGVGLWLGFELALAPLLDLTHHKRHGAAGYASLLADHALYGLVITADR